ncbi:hypothetical protein ACFQ07_33665 [Actinomadura adrarensis]|uniref:Uncharacterized protein n=1 Tax=Actinomadura adrarensis TaxID=1819600 RepID=A0ABW3CSK5_9ACTN
MRTTTALEHLAILLRGYGLLTEPCGTGLAVSNPITSALSETVYCDEFGSFITAWGYAFGQRGQEAAAADRLAFLLGVPSCSTRAGSPIVRPHALQAETSATSSVVDSR